MNLEIAVPLLCALIATAITLLSAWNWKGGRYLCENCKFNSPDLCHKSERPKAIMCKAYREIKKDSAE